jgi:hypothetical protein
LCLSPIFLARFNSLLKYRARQLLGNGKKKKVPGGYLGPRRDQGTIVVPGLVTTSRALVSPACRNPLHSAPPVQCNLRSSRQPGCKPCAFAPSAGHDSLASQFLWGRQSIGSRKKRRCKARMADDQTDGGTLEAGGRVRRVPARSPVEESAECGRAERKGGGHWVRAWDQGVVGHSSTTQATGKQ